MIERLRPEGTHGVVAVIPARGGSRRIPGKNVRPFAGRPAIAYAIDAARASGLFDRIVVSTDSDTIAAVAEAAGADVPFRRPAVLADDFATTAAVLADALERLGGTGGLSHACCIYPVVPFLRPCDLRVGYDTIREGGILSAFAVSSYPGPIQRALRIAEDGTLRMFWPEHRDSRSNDLPQAWRDAAQFYWVDVALFLRELVLYGDSSRPVPIPRHRAHDIDTEEDWQLAELVHRALHPAGAGPAA
ncbi:MAG: pseudaminic acid cytidylyltransferase [Alphaproteobacteria bacterium]